MSKVRLSMYRTHIIADYSNRIFDCSFKVPRWGTTIWKHFGLAKPTGVCIFISIIFVCKHAMHVSKYL